MPQRSVAPPVSRPRRSLVMGLGLGLGVSLGLGAALAAPRRVWAQPASPASGLGARPVRLLPFGSAGGPIDRIARVLADPLQQRLGQPVIVEPKPGASGILAADAVAKAAPDGHTLLMTLPLTHINAAILNPRLPYDPDRDFVPLGTVGTGSPLLLARADAPYATLREFLAHARAKGGASYGSWGIGSGAHLFGELLRRQAGVELVHVPYKSESQNHADLHGGVLDVTWANPGSARGQAGKARILGVTGTRRMSLFPAVPTFAEQGHEGFDIDSWIGVFAPARTPAPVVALLDAALRDIGRLPEVRERLLDAGFEPTAAGGADLAARLRSDRPRLAALIKAAGVTAE